MLSHPFFRFFVLGSLVLSLFPFAFAADYPSPVTLSGKLVVNQMQLSWTQNKNDNFKYYRLVRSSYNNLPEYPDEDALWFTDKKDNLSYNDTIEAGSPYYYRICVVNTQNNVRCSNIVHVDTDKSVKSFSFYSDIESGSWYEEFVENLYRKGIVSTQKGTRFYPGNLVNRAELAEMLVKGVVSDESKLSKAQVFCDVSSSHPQAQYINYLHKSGVVEGYSGGTCSSKRLFKPSQSVNRAEALKMILAAFGVKVDASSVKDEGYKYKSTDIYTDVHQSDWFAPYVWQGKMDGIVSGYPDDTFRPQNTINKAEMAKIIYNAVKKYL